MGLCAYCGGCGGAYGECYPVVCARCGEPGCSYYFEIEEGDDWECAPCNERENQREQEQ